MKNNQAKNILLAVMFAALLVACNRKTPPLAEPVSSLKSESYYTCSMHPQVHKDHPGECPICSMKLIKVEMTENRGNTNMNRIVLTRAQIQLAGITTDTVREENTGSETTLTGTVTTDENQEQDISARIAGRIQRLFVRTTGQKIVIGQPLYAVYSEDLLESEKEYLLAWQQQKQLHNADIDYSQILAAAENKLLLWGLTKPQIRNLGITGKVSATVNIFSKVSGTVSELSVHEGDYVTEGMSILKTQALGSLWVESQLYANETGNFKEGMPVMVSFPDLNGQMIKGNVSFINPELSDASKVALIRISILNHQGLIRSGMLAYVSVSSQNRRSIAVPASSVITDGKGDKVWIRNADGSFSSKSIKAGNSNQHYVAVLSGINSGDVVVTYGAYLLNSEAYFKTGGDQMSMGNMKM